MVADGLGNLLAGPADADILTVRVGSYKVNGDCTLAVTLVDGFRSGLDLLGDALLGARDTFEGVLQNRGNEVNLVQTGQRRGAAIYMSRPYLAQNCTQTALSGPYGLAATGLQLGTTEMPAIQPLALLGRFHAENGAFILDTPGAGSPLAKRQFTGTYRVEPDCTGTADFVIDGQKLRAAFVLLRGGVKFGVFERAEMRFTFQDAARIGAGIAR
jgi:hypothetical protein